MSLESDLFNTLKTLVSNRVYPDVAPLGVVKPYMTYQQVGGDAPTFLEAAVPSKRNGRMQINVWSTTRGEANSLALQVEAALVAATVFQAKPLVAFVSDKEDETNLFGTRQDFSIWSNR
ncbi:DUF3168 domain-containing protein [Variovorax sp. RT4R15]|uniref:DUF3168 domain-containing protein n=1 Tax=Variovorax sp. RT4R15 TaxID=3443737 RepID=UPI003F46AB17